MARCLATIAALLVGLAATPAAQEDDVVYAPGNGVSLPRVIRDVRPNYTADAMRAGVEGVVVIEAIVLPNGRSAARRYCVRSIRITDWTRHR